MKGSATSSGFGYGKKSIVLLKNENELLPLKKSGLKIALGHWQMIRQPIGSWRIAADDESAVSVEGLQSMKEINLCQRS
jgi:beta-glucosidase